MTVRRDGNKSKKSRLVERTTGSKNGCGPSLKEVWGVIDSRRITELRKAGKLDEAFKLAETAIKENPKDPMIQTAYGWVLYEQLKGVADSAKENEKLKEADSRRLTVLLRQYAKLDRVKKPGMLHSNILNQVLKLSSGWPEFLSFARWWGEGLFRDEDREPQLWHGKKYPSLESKYYLAVAKELDHEDHTVSAEIRSWAEQTLKHGLEKYPDDIWLLYHTGQILAQKGDNEAARKCLAPVLREKKGEGWAWAALGSTFAGEDPERALLCLFYALELEEGKKELTTLGIRRKLVDLLVRLERYEEAAPQCKAICTILQKNGYPISKAPEKDCVKTAWYHKYKDLEAGRAASEIRSEALKILQDLDPKTFVEKIGVLQNHNLEKSLAFVAFAPQEGVPLKYKRFPAIRRAAPGTMWLVKMEEGGYVEEISSIETREIPGFFESFAGKLQIPPNMPFAFVHDRKGNQIFVPEEVCRSLGQVVEGQLCSGKAIKTLDKKKQKLGWKALEIRIGRKA